MTRSGKASRCCGRRDTGTCPYHAIVWNEEQQLPQTWIFDAHLLDAGWNSPRCQQVCPTDVFEVVKLDDAAMQEKARREGLGVLLPKLGAKPRVYYRGLERWERCFIGGSVSASVGGLVDCVAGADVALHQGDSLVATALTDAFGDFRFDGLPARSGAYRLEIRHGSGVARRDCELDESVYLGEIMMLCTLSRVRLLEKYWSVIRLSSRSASVRTTPEAHSRIRLTRA